MSDWKNEPCSVAGCHRKAEVRRLKLCHAHYLRLRIHGSVLTERPIGGGFKYRQQTSPAYARWDSMKQRCLNPHARNYHNYGGRGITVCERWMKFENFLEDMGEPPPGLQLERMDNSKGYFKENCKWATRLEQRNNTRQNRYLTFNGRTQTIQQWAREINLSPDTIRSRLRTHWPVELILTQKSLGSGHRRWEFGL